MVKMVDHARACAPNEACGLVAMLGGTVTQVYALTNTDASPDRFTLDPAEHFAAIQHAESNGWAIAGAFHSHPSSAPIPSPADLGGGGDPGWVNLIVGVEGGRTAVRAYRYVEGGATTGPHQVRLISIVHLRSSSSRASRHVGAAWPVCQPVASVSDIR
jgi:proteasome lid subunit RPN8/RPN11